MPTTSLTKPSRHQQRSQGKNEKTQTLGSSVTGGSQASSTETEKTIAVVTGFQSLSLQSKFKYLDYEDAPKLSSLLEAH